MGWLDIGHIWKKKVWDVIDSTRPEPTTAAQMKKKDKNNTIASKIIKQGVNSNFYTNIIGECDL